MDKHERERLYWVPLETRLVADCEVFSVTRTLAASKCGQNKESGFHTIKCRNWVNVIALTSEMKVVMVEQYRHGIRDLTLEIPGGCIDESDESTQSAAARELLEETGFASGSWTLLGKTHPNPALQDNICFTYLAENATQVEEPQFDSTGTERLRNSLLPLSQIVPLIRSGKIDHSLVITAFHFLRIQRPDLFEEP